MLITFSLFSAVAPPAAADQIGAALASMTIYLLMAVVLAIRPKGVFGGRD